MEFRAVFHNLTWPEYWYFVNWKSSLSFLRSYLNKSRVKTMRLLNHHWKIILTWTLKLFQTGDHQIQNWLSFLWKSFLGERFFPFRNWKFKWMNLKGRMSRLRKATKSAWMIERSRIREENFKKPMQLIEIHLIETHLIETHLIKYEIQVN
jgi:hypothetical protein